jgi:hypothetical protein
MQTETLTPDHILDESDAALRAELLRLEQERKRIVGRLDQRISRLRRIVEERDPMPLFAGIVNQPPEPSSSIEAESEERLPRGDTKRRIFEFLLANPNAGYPELVAAIWGEVTTRTHANARNAIAALKKDGWLSGERGHWKIERTPTRK